MSVQRLQFVTCHDIPRFLRASFGKIGIYLFVKIADHSTLATANSVITINIRSLSDTDNYVIV